MMIFLLICIRPDDSYKESSYFQFNLLVGAAIKLTDATLNFSKIEFIENNLLKPFNEPVIHLISNSSLLLNVNIFFDSIFYSVQHILLQNIIYKIDNYLFLWADKSSHFQLINSNIRNNTNLVFYCFDTRIDVINTSFSEITNTKSALIFIDNYFIPNAVLNFINTNFEY